MAEPDETEQAGDLKIERMMDAVLGWLAAVTVGSLVLSILLGTADQITFDPASGHRRQVFLVFLYFFMGWCVMFVMTALPLLVAVFAFRAMKLPRAWADIIFCAPMGLVLGTMMLTRGEWQFWELSTTQQLSLPAFFISGAVAGYVYWRVAGRPRPPYRSIV
jgi:hypothetical protein